MFTALYAINIRTKQITFPKQNELDEDLQVVGSILTWFRKKEKDYQDDVWV